MTEFVVIEVIAVLAFLGSLTFTVLYARLKPMSKGLAARMQFNLALSLTLVIALGLANAFFEDYPGRSIVRLAVYVYLVLAIWNQVRVLIKLQHEPPGPNYGRRKDDLCRKDENIG